MVMLGQRRSRGHLRACRPRLNRLVRPRSLGTPDTRTRPP
jgi:hypothetical protein